jgi:hypothetical protein
VAYRLNVTFQLLFFLLFNLLQVSSSLKFPSSVQFASNFFKLLSKYVVHQLGLLPNCDVVCDCHCLDPFPHHDVLLDLEVFFLYCLPMAIVIMVLVTSSLSSLQW